MLLDVFLIRLFHVQIAEVLRWHLLGRRHVVAVTVAQIAIGTLHTHEGVALEADGSGLAIDLTGLYSTLGFVVVIGHKSGLLNGILALQGVEPTVEPRLRQELMTYFDKETTDSAPVFVRVALCKIHQTNQHVVAFVVDIAGQGVACHAIEGKHIDR